MPVYGSAWDSIKNLLNRFLDWLTEPAKKPPDPPDDPPTEEHE